MHRIVFTGGGTGGHVYPGIAVYQYLPPRLQDEVLWICSRTGVERSILEGAGIPVEPVPTGKLRRYFDLENVRDLGRVVAGFFAARRVLRESGAEVLFSKGGYVAVPVVLAARSLGIPVLIHESDTTPGLATRITARHAGTVFAGYPQLRETVSPRVSHRVVVSGNPVRAAFFEADPAVALERLGLHDDGSPVLLVTGGSLGARQLNELVVATVAELTETAILVHQTGEHGKEMIPAIRSRARPGRYHGAPAFDLEFPALLRRADLVVARAGAGTIQELAATGTAAVLVPLSARASRGDQIRNAQDYRAAGAAEVLPSEGLTADRFLARIQALLADPEARAAMSRAARALAGGNAAQTIAQAIEDALDAATTPPESGRF